jgi:2-methylcitrate dehydratase PrpD
MNAIDIIHDLTWEELPAAVRSAARRCLLDTVGAGLGGRQTDLSRIIHDFAAAAYGGQGGRLWVDGREVSPPGAALANGMTIDSLDIHDGHSWTKGHAGAAVVPAVMSTLGLAKGVSGRELLVSLVVGYEIAIRSGVALHATTCDYHTSGAWNALGCAAITARRMGLTAEQTRHALGIAEYHGPRSPMMRCIDFPTMLKDGSGWGAMSGVSAAMLAQAGFTGAPAVLVEAPETAEYWADLGEGWRVAEQYFKRHAVCRWAQPAMEGALALQQAHGLAIGDIRRIRVTTFAHAVRLCIARPNTTEAAQYSLPFPVAAALVHGRLGPRALTGPALNDETVLALADRVELVEDPALSQRFPRERIARVQIERHDGASFETGEVHSRWEAGAPASDDEVLEKFRWLAAEALPAERAAALEDALWRCEDLPEAAVILDSLTPPVPK